MRFRIILIEGMALGILSLSIFGCATKGTIKEKPEIVKPSEPVQVRQETSEGSLWLPGSQNSLLFADHKARYVNDLITVSIVESASATNKASSKTDRKNSVSMDIPNFLGAPPGARFMNFWGNGQGFSPTISASTDNEFNGSGETSINGSLSATMTARVVEVLPNNNLRIEGRRDIRVNHETQSIILSGIVRLKDISQDNVVLSSNIADQKIAFIGKGIVSERQKPGWMTRALGWIWPF
ncbi:MAG: flagellar basal body L-ring protein FlgH [Deltaproteobacteria bacterium]|nr:flagellar basal body L-ring protein FlgH [Deltaproteobacteria bacterium]MBW2306801.1 flagellar basal body L-ring protein FlgH [Deltaproteobacteria bacterium]